MKINTTEKREISSLAVRDLVRRKKISRTYLRSLSPDEKVKRLAILQEQYYTFLAAREANGGKPVPEKWQKWYRVRCEYTDSLANKNQKN